MSTEKSITPPQPITFQELRKLIPDKWKGVEICISTGSIESAERIARISLHQNQSGKKVILLHTKELHPEK